MSEDLEKKLLAGTAYRIFCEELGKHLEATSTLFVSTGWSSDQLQEASARFHTIRGGAGFFKLSEVATLAGELEKRLADPDMKKVVAEIETLRELDQRLRVAASGIPAPKPA